MILTARVSGASIVSVVGDLDRFDQAAFRVVFVMATSPKLIVDLTRCRYIDSAGLTVLVEQRRSGRPLVLVMAPGAKVRKLFAITGLARLFRIVSYLDDAFAAAD